MSSALGGDLPDWNRRVSSTDDVLITTLTLAAGASSAVLDVSQYNSLILDPVSSQPLQNKAVVIAWLNPAGHTLFSDYISQFNSANLPQLVVPARAQAMRVTAVFGVGTMTFNLYGSMRAQLMAVSQGYKSPVAVTVAAAALAANTIYTIGSGYPQGWCQVDLILSNPAVTGEFLIEYMDDALTVVDQRFADTSEFHTVSGNSVWHGQVIFPSVPFILKFICRAAGNSAITANVIALGA